MENCPVLLRFETHLIHLHLHHLHHYPFHPMELNQWNLEKNIGKEKLGSN